jgi:ADP-ribose pyrophosphatase YjhB (NUDIX family)
MQATRNAAHIGYPTFMPGHMRYRRCPMCSGELVPERDAGGHLRPTCATCNWTYYPSNVLGVVIVVTTLSGVVFLFPPGEPAEAPAALPAGCVEFGETLEEAVAREAREETGLEVKITRELRGRWFDRDCALGPMVSFFFEARAVGGALRDGVEGRVATFRNGSFPVISPNRAGSQLALAAFIAARTELRRGTDQLRRR